MLYSICRGGYSYEAVVCVRKEHGPTAGMADYALANMVHSTGTPRDAHIFSHHRLKTQDSVLYFKKIWGCGMNLSMVDLKKQLCYIFVQNNQ